MSAWTSVASVQHTSRSSNTNRKVKRLSIYKQTAHAKWPLTKKELTNIKILYCLVSVYTENGTKALIETDNGALQ